LSARLVAHPGGRLLSGDCKLLNWSGRVDLNHQPPGPEPHE